MHSPVAMCVFLNDKPQALIKRECRVVLEDSEEHRYFTFPAVILYSVDEVGSDSSALELREELDLGKVNGVFFINRTEHTCLTKLRTDDPKVVRFEPREKLAGVPTPPSFNQRSHAHGVEIIEKV